MGQDLSQIHVWPMQDLDIVEPWYTQDPNIIKLWCTQDIYKDHCYIIISLSLFYFGEGAVFRVETYISTF